jgi:hypothetical protein
LQAERAHTDLVTPLEQRRQKYLKRKGEHGDRSDEVGWQYLAFCTFLLLFFRFPVFF